MSALLKMSAIPDLPSIVVIGPQSTGKSSVLTRIIGHDILPRGPSLTTRCIIRIELRTLSSSINKPDSNEIDSIIRKIDAINEYEQNKQHEDQENQNDIDKLFLDDNTQVKQKMKEFAIFDDKTRKKYTIKSLKSQIQKRMTKMIEDYEEKHVFKKHDKKSQDKTYRESTSNMLNRTHSATCASTESTLSKHIINEELKVTLFLHNTLPLTLIDLPGLINIPTSDQNIEISEETHNIALFYIKQPNSIILAIINACVDIVNANSLNLIKRADPFFKKTLGIVTKIDLLDDQQRIKEILKNKVIYLQNGYFGLVNSNVGIEECIRKETDFFQNFFIQQTTNINQVNSQLKHQNYNLGIEQLKNKLFSIFSNSIQNFIFYYKNKIKIEYETLSDLINPNLYFKIIDKYVENTSTVIKNVIDHELFNTSENDNDEYEQTDFSSNNNLKTHSILLKDRNIKIPKTNIFMNESLFKRLLQEKVKFIESQILELLERMYSRMIVCIEKEGFYLNEQNELSKENFFPNQTQNEMNGDKISNRAKKYPKYTADPINITSLLTNSRTNKKTGSSFLKSIIPFFNYSEDTKIEETNTKNTISIHTQRNNKQQTPYSTKSDTIPDNPFLKENINSLNTLIMSKLKNNKLIIKDKLLEYINIQLSHINLNHSDFQSHNINIELSVSNLTNQLLKFYLSNYYLIIKKEITNYFIKIVYFYFENEIRENIKWEIMEKWKVGNKTEIEKRVKEIKRVLRVFEEF